MAETQTSEPAFTPEQKAAARVVNFEAALVLTVLGAGLGALFGGSGARGRGALWGVAVALVGPPALMWAAKVTSP